MASRFARALALVAVLLQPAVAAAERGGGSWRRIDRAGGWELRHLGQPRYASRPGTRLIGEPVESPHTGDLAFVEHRAKAGRAPACELVVLLASWSEHPPLRWPLPRCDPRLRPHWAGERWLTLGPSLLAPWLSVRFSIE